MEDTFAEHLYAVDLEEVKSWYNGYQWLGESELWRIDLTLRFKQPDGQRQVYIFEFKVIDAEDGSALRQLKARDYAAKYADGESRVFLVGMEFSRVVRNIVGFEWVEYGS